jgi:dipeptidyl aminopeptidase/acylaminoacyl peptidase
MSVPKVAPFGSWKSPITTDLIVSETIKLGQIALDGNDVYWVETRPAEEGRNVIVQRTSTGQTRDMTPPPFNARTRVHEYGGGSFVVFAGTIYFANFVDQRLYRQDGEAAPVPITPEKPYRYADMVVDKSRNRLICVREDHSRAGHEPTNTLVAFGYDGITEQLTLVHGNDFYASPRISSDGSRLAWLTWSHPNLPWDGTELWVGELNAAGSLLNPHRVAGGKSESIFQPEWSPDGSLYFISDRTGWWNFYRWSDDGPEDVYPMEAEFGRPQWIFGMTTYDFAQADRIITAYTRGGIWHLASLNPITGVLDVIEAAYTELLNLHATPTSVVFCGGSPTQPTSIVRFEFAHGSFQSLRRSSDVVVDRGYLSMPEAIEFPTEHGKTSHAFFYPPNNLEFAAPSGTLPPLLVKSHGGPTAATSTSLAWDIQYWTSRGIAVLDVNYGGSTGYGREYRERLAGQWGVVDVDDCVNGASYLVEQGRVDGARLAIRGSSAGGYTTLCALTFRELFRAGASYYGISELEALAKETHKFEARYLDRLIGPFPQRMDLYQERSPIYYTEKLSCPLIIFQGLEDEIVPPNQAEMMVEALREKGLAVAYVAFPGEQHGFRRAETIKRALDAELYFYSKIFDFELAEAVEPVDIENL